MIAFTQFNRPVGLQSTETVRFNGIHGVIVCICHQPSQAQAILIIDKSAPPATHTDLLTRALKVKPGLAVDRADLAILLLGHTEFVRAISAQLKQLGVTNVQAQNVQASTGFDATYSPKTQRLEQSLLAQIADTAPAGAQAPAKVKVMIVDDSQTVRKVLRHIFESEKNIEVVADIGDPKEAEAAVEKFKPDVVTLDIHMPDIDGITLLKRLVARFKVPCIMISSISYEEGAKVLGALEAGAFDYIEKPTFDQMKSMGSVIAEKIRLAAGSRRHNRNVDPVIPPLHKEVIRQDLPILIGSSTGGTEALRHLLTPFPQKIPPILIVQHIPPIFSQALAGRLSTQCQFPVREARDGDKIEPGVALIAPGGKHMALRREGPATYITISKEPENTIHRPSVDVFFESALQMFGGKAVGVILTGMGSDGAKGLLALRKAGAKTFGQDEKSCVVYGMPRRAFELGAVEHQLPLAELPAAICHFLTKRV